MTVNTENVRRWTEALRSGDYEQTTHKLRDSDGKMCCLGVACDVSGLGSWEERTTETGRRSWFYVIPDGGYEADILPSEVRDWLGFTSGNPAVVASDVVGEESGMASLAELNDTYSYTFEQIADLAEEQLL